MRLFPPPYLRPSRPLLRTERMRHARTPSRRRRLRWPAYEGQDEGSRGGKPEVNPQSDQRGQRCPDINQREDGTCLAAVPVLLPRPTCVFLASPPTSSARPCIALTPIRAQRCRRLACQASGRRASELTVHFHLDRGLVIGVRLPLQMKPRATCPLLPLLASPPRVDRTHRGAGPRPRR